MNVIETKRGLPNNDALTGDPIGGFGYARNVDEARSGIIFKTVDNLMEYHHPPADNVDDFVVIERLLHEDATPELVLDITDAAARLLGERHVSGQEVAEYFESSKLTIKMVREYLSKPDDSDTDSPDDDE